MDLLLCLDFYVTADLSTRIYVPCLSINIGNNMYDMMLVLLNAIFIVNKRPVYIVDS